MCLLLIFNLSCFVGESEPYLIEIQVIYRESAIIKGVAGSESTRVILWVLLKVN